MKDNVVNFSHQPRGRYAPSPSGRMHLGNALCALLSYLSIKKQDGLWVLRIEDLDVERSKPHFAQWVEDDLHWLGLEWDEGGLDNKGNGTLYSQSQRADIYDQHIDKLNKSRLLYPCFCTRHDRLVTQAPHQDDERLTGCNCKYLSKEQQAHCATLRTPSLKLDSQGIVCHFHDLHYGNVVVENDYMLKDFVVRRADGMHAYQLAVVVDDALMHITEVVRGRDLIDATPQQLFLYHLLGFKPPQFAHIPLVCADDGRRLCKRNQAQAFDTLRQHFLPEEIIGRLAYLSGLLESYQPIDAQSLIPLFSWDKITLNNILLHTI